MNIIDITQPLTHCAVYPGDTPPKLTLVKTAGIDGVNLTDITMCAHNGTHVDAPFHFLDDGLGIGEVPLDVFIGKCVVRTWDGTVPAGCERLLIRGDYILTEDDARLLVNAGVRLVGVESQSVGDGNAPRAVHMVLLGAEVIPLEGLVLGHVPDGEYFLSAPPLNLGKSDGSPVRAVLLPL